MKPFTFLTGEVLTLCIPGEEPKTFIIAKTTPNGDGTWDADLIPDPGNP